LTDQNRSKGYSPDTGEIDLKQLNQCCQKDLLYTFKTLYKEMIPFRSSFSLNYTLLWCDWYTVQEQNWIDSVTRWIQVYY